MFKRHSCFGALIVMLAAAVAVAACSGGGTAPSSAPGGTNSAAAGATDAGNAGAGAGSSSCNPIGGTVGSAGGPYASVVGAALCGLPDLDPCSKLAQPDVQALFSVPLGTSTTDHTGDCTWPLSDPSMGDGLDVVVNVGQGEGPLDQDMGLSDVTPISGIGDHASWGLLAGYFPHLGAVKGQDTCELTIGGGNGQLSVHTSGKGVFAKIDDAAVPGFMQQFGALCDQIFAGLGE